MLPSFRTARKCYRWEIKFRSYSWSNSHFERCWIQMTTSSAPRMLQCVDGIHDGGAELIFLSDVMTRWRRTTTVVNTLVSCNERMLCDCTRKAYILTTTKTCREHHRQHCLWGHKWKYMRPLQLLLSLDFLTDTLGCSSIEVLRGDVTGSAYCNLAVGYTLD